MTEGLTPIRKQYLRIKRQYPGAIVFFRLGDFYETFDEDAELMSSELDIVLTSREMGKGVRVPLAGIPYHAIDNYLSRLINRGYKVAICEQLTKPGETKGLVERDVVRVVTPGTVVEPNLLDSKANNYLVSIVPGKEEVGIAYVDITTSEFATTQLPVNRAMPELVRLKPSEIIVAESADISGFELNAPVTTSDDLWFELEEATETLLKHFGSVTLEGYGCARLPLAVRAAGAIIEYLKETQKGALGQLRRLSSYSTESFMALDVQTQKNLELFQSANGTIAGSLLSILDLTTTPMGGRLLRRWLGQPLLDVNELEKRQEAIKWLRNSTMSRGRIVHLLEHVVDVERIINRVRSLIATPRELVALRRSLEVIPEMRLIHDDQSVTWLKEELKPRQDVVELLAEAIVDDPPNLDEGGVIKPGLSSELDELRLSASSSKQYLTELEQRERERTGIKSLKVGYNRVFGYYLEISNANLSQVPDDYIRKQTLTNGERFITSELKEYEAKILNAQNRITGLEVEIFERVCRQVATVSEQVLAVAGVLAHVDVFIALADVATRYGYVRPRLGCGNSLVIKEGRHPVVERSLEDGSFVANDTELSNEDNQIVILTGPNMAGKSTYLRQIALIVLMAQIGSYIPAGSADIGLVDRIFTRIGAYDDLTAGRSTFMVEMVETANILNNATPRSLVILDEIGRGTSTYDGMAIAQAVVEYLHNHPGLGAKTVFATHYHELVELAGLLPRVKNFNVAVSEEHGEVVFLRRILPGGVDKSYGIHVAQLAGLPKPVINRAQEVLAELEIGQGRDVVYREAGVPKPDNLKPSPKDRGRGREKVVQVSFFGPKSPLADELDKLDIESLTPMEAINKLYELQKKAGEESMDKGL
ncbi:DNA mismatch repair protein MutS [Chloroflexota bacterium]